MIYVSSACVHAEKIGDVLYMYYPVALCFIRNLRMIYNIMHRKKR